MSGENVGHAPGAAIDLGVERAGLGHLDGALWSQFTALYYREIVRTFRNPLVLLFTMTQPFMWLVFFGNSLSGASCSALEALFHTCQYINFVLPGVLCTSMLGMGMFGSMSTIQDKRFGYLKRILITPTRKSVVFCAKALGATSRGMIQFPMMIGAAAVFGVRISMPPVDWAAWILAIFLLGMGFCSLFLAITASSTDWQTPGVLSNFITLPLMFASGALFGSANFPPWMVDISNVNPITFGTLFGRSLVLGTPVNWDYLGYLSVFAAVMVTIGLFVYSRWLKIE